MHESIKRCRETPLLAAFSQKILHFMVIAWLAGKVQGALLRQEGLPKRHGTCCVTSKGGVPEKEDN